MNAANHQRVIILAPAGNDGAEIAAMLQRDGIACVVSRDGAETCALMEGGAGALLATEEALELRDTDVAIAFLRSQPPWSELPIIMLSSGSTEATKRLVERTNAAAGSITLLERPLVHELLVRAVRVALKSRARQYQVRDLLAEQKRRQTELEEAKHAAELELERRRDAEAALGLWASVRPDAERFSPLYRHAIAALIIGASMVVRVAFDPLVHEQLPLSALFGAVPVIVWVCGMWPAIVWGLVGYVASDWMFIPPRREWTYTAADGYAFLLFSLAGGLTIAIGARMRQAEEKARASARLALERQRNAERALQERDEAELKARELDERLRVAVKSSGFVLAECDRQLRYRWIHDPNGEFATTFGVGRRDDECDTSEAAARLLELKQRVVNTGRGVSDDLTFLRPDGPRTYAVTVEPLRDATGEVVGATTAAIDITDRKVTEDRLRRSEEQARQQFAELEAIYHGAPLGLALFDLELRFRRINDRLAEITGRSAADHIGRTIEDVLPSFAAQAREIVRRILERGEPVRFEFTGDTKQEPGLMRIWDEQWYPVRDSHGMITGIAVMAEDITHRRRTEQAIRENEELFRALAENVPQLAWMARADGSIFWYNRRWFDYTGTTLAQVQGWGWQRVHHPEHVQRVVAGFRRAITKGVPWEDTFPLRAADGHYRWFLTRAFPIHDTAGRITRWFGTNTDITVLRKTEEALREAQAQIRQYAASLEKTVAERTAKLQETVQELEAFSYSIAHDMRAPLRSMIGYAEIVREEHAPGIDEDGKEYLRRITVSARRLDRLIQDVLNYSRIVRADMPLEPVDLCQLCAEVIDSYPNLAAVKETITLDPAIPAIQANRAALTQVVSNLLENAVKFVPAEVKPSVRVYAEATVPPRPEVGGAWIRVCVEDNGIGIDPGVRPRLFQMFQRFTRPGLYEGTGIGLAIARKAVDRMGGTIGVDSAAGRGSRFWFVLPLATNDSHVPAPTS